MTEEQTFNHIVEIYHQDPQHEATPEVIALLDRAVAAFPESAQLWCLRGNLMSLGSDETTHSLEEVLRSYQRAIAIDPDFAEAHEDLGYYYDTIEDDQDAAEAAFRRALAIEPREAALTGLARVLAQKGDVQQALALLKPEANPFHSSPATQELLAELLDGLWWPDETFLWSQFTLEGPDEAAGPWVEVHLKVNPLPLKELTIGVLSLTGDDDALDDTDAAQQASAHAEAACAGIEHGLKNLKNADLAPISDVKVLQIVALRPGAPPEAVAWAACEALWQALQDPGLNRPTVSDGKIRWPGKGLGRG